jgi:hypothetical protein
MPELSPTDVLRKTALGRSEQQQRSSALTARQRHVLILCDGRRPLGELCSLMGEEALALAQALMASGHVEKAAAVAAAVVVPSAVPAAQLVQAVAPPPKRSIALARMYMFDMVERLLGAQSGPARTYLRAADHPEALLQALHDCLRLIAEVAGSVQADKVRAQLCTMLPEDWVAQFRPGHQPQAAAAA